MPNASPKRDRQTTTVSLSAGLATIVMWQLGYWLPDMMAAAPTGLEAAIVAVIAGVASRLSRAKE